MLNKRPLVLLLLLLYSGLSGFLMSKISIVGKMGIFLFYRNYSFLKIWWQPAMLVFIIYYLAIAVFRFSSLLMGKRVGTFIGLPATFIAISGLVYSYYDFNHDVSHRLLGTGFHVGVYLFWLGLIIIYLFLSLRTTQTQNNI
jgi:hypothetical protein